MQQTINKKGIDVDNLAKSFLKKPSKENKTLFMRLIGLTLAMKKWSDSTGEDSEINIKNFIIEYNPKTKSYSINDMDWDGKIGVLATLVDRIIVDENVLRLTDSYLKSFK